MAVARCGEAGGLAYATADAADAEEDSVTETSMPVVGRLMRV